MSNSPLVTYTKISPHRTSPRRSVIDQLTIHCMAGNGSIETCGQIFQDAEASSNYGIGSDGRIALYVEEKDASWCSSSGKNDNRSVTIEVANDGGADTGWHVSDKALMSLIALCADICKRNGIKKLLWQADKNLIGQIDKQNMTVHRWFENKACPGDYLYTMHYYIAEEVNKILESEEENMDLKNLTDAQIDDLMARINERLSVLPESEYAKEASAKAVKSGLFSDGDKNELVDNPQGFLRRQELAVVLNRAGILDKEY